MLYEVSKLCFKYDLKYNTQVYILSLSYFKNWSRAAYIIYVLFNLYNMVKKIKVSKDFKDNSFLVIIEHFLLSVLECLCKISSHCRPE